MAHHYLSGFLILSAFFLLQASSRPSNNELTTPISMEETTELTEERLPKELEEEKYASVEENTKDILDKIKVVNAGLKKPNRRQQSKYNTESPNIGGYVLNRDILEKLQQIIASGKLQPLLETENYQESNSLNNYDPNIQRYSKSLPYSPNAIMGNHIGASLVPLPTVTTIPVLVMPSLNAYNPGLVNEYHNADGPSQYQTRQSPPSFTFQWPLAQYFPILVKDPFLAILQGGGWANIFEVGQSADVCSRKQKSAEDSDEVSVEEKSNTEVDDNNISNHFSHSSREGRGLKKRNIQSKPTSVEDDLKTQKKIEKFLTKPNTTQKPTKQQLVSSGEPPKNTKNHDEDDGALRFGAFSFFGDKKPVAPSPGFFINKLKVRRGGVAIAGPGGVATAGRGGTAIVGPGGLAYTQPGGLAVAGPAARVVALSPESNLSTLVSQLQQLSAKDGFVPRQLKTIPEGKVVATGPVIYYHPNDQS